MIIVAASGQLIRYAIYTRQSVDRPADFSSCDAQFEKCQVSLRATTDDLRWLGGRFDDHGYSGGTLDRPALTRLRKRAADGDLDRIYVTALDRLSRRVFDLIALLEEFEKASVAVHVAQELQPPVGAQAKFIRHILGVFAEFEREMIATRIAERRAYLKAHGRRLAGPVPLGYRADPRSKQLVPVPKEARRVRLIFERAARGQTPAYIASRINHLKWRTKTWVAQRSGITRGGGKWTARQVLYLLRNPVYSGHHRDRAAARPGCHPPIVGQDLFNRVQVILDGRRTITNPSRQRGDSPLRGKIICPRCGRRLSTQLSSRPLHRGRVQARFYCCRSSAGGRAPCRGVRYRAYDVDMIVCRRLGEPTLWSDLLPPERAGDAADFAAVWSRLGDRMQRDLIGQMVERVAFKRKNTEMQITLSERCVELLSPQLQAITQARCKPPG